MTGTGRRWCGPHSPAVAIDEVHQLVLASALHPHCRRIVAWNVRRHPKVVGFVVVSTLPHHRIAWKAVSRTTETPQIDVVAIAEHNE